MDFLSDEIAEEFSDKCDFTLSIDECLGLPMVEFVINGFVPGKQSVRYNPKTKKFVLAKKTREAMDGIRMYIMQNMRELGLKMHDGPATIEVLASYEWKKKTEMPLFYIDTPDLDNIQKTLYDGICYDKKKKLPGLVKDDKMFFNCNVTKQWDTRSWVRVIIVFY